MTNVSKLNSVRDRRNEDAAAWVAALARELSLDEERDLRDWLAADPRHRSAFIHMAELWDDLNALQRLAELFPEPQRVSGHRWLSIAATLLVTVLASAFFLLGPANNTQSTPVAATPLSIVSYQTMTGEQKTVRLADGSDLTLNTGSKVRVELTPGNRKVFLERGEINLKVAHDATRRMSVFVEDTVVQAIGTEFNIEITEDKTIELVVTEGLVLVGFTDQAAPGGSEEPVILPDSSSLIGAGKEVVIDTRKRDASTLAQVDVEPEDIAVKLSWRQGNLIFRGESLEEAVAEVERYIEVEFVFLDDEARRVRVAGLFKTGDVDGLLAALRNHFNIRYEWQDGKTILLGSNE